MTHRRYEAGGDPAHAPPPETDDPAPRRHPVGFPDVPPDNRSTVPPGHEGDPHRVDPDAFAERLGLRPEPGDDGRSTGRHGRAAVRRGRDALGRLAHATSGLLDRASRGLERLADRLDGD